MPHRALISRRYRIAIPLALALFAHLLPAQRPPDHGLTPRNPNALETPAPLRPLTTLREAHSLSALEARRGYPIHVRAVVTYYDAQLDSRRIAIFLHDNTGSMFAAVPQGTVWPTQPPVAGTRVSVSGISAPGDFAPIIDQASITVLGPARLPASAPTVTLPDLLSGDEDSHWVQIEGVVHAVSETDTNVTLKIAMTGGFIGALTVKRPCVDYTHLVDKWVHLRGNAAPMFNSNSQLTGARIFFPDLETVDAFAPGPPGAFDLPIQPINALLRFNPAVLWPHRIHVRGAVTLFWPGRTVCIHDDTGGLCADISQTDPVALGSLVDIAGFTTLAGFSPILADATFRPTPGKTALAATPITPEQALRGEYDSRLVQIDGRLIGRADAAGDSNLILSSNNLLYRAILPTSLAGPALSRIPIGSKLRLSGICSVQVDAQRTLQGYGVTQASSFWILLNSPRNLVVLQTPSWWTVGRIRLLLLFTLVFTAAAIAWVFILRRRVDQQTRELRESRELYRHMAHHDTLTGLPTRALLHDRLQIALDRVQRFHKCIALLMLDLDNFKHINDSSGHDSGDHVLRTTAERIAAAIRKTDSVARMGGDEFIVLLNDLDGPGQAERIATKLIAALSVPIPIGKVPVPISVSIGVCTLADNAIDAELLLKRVDAAMYQAKARGRGCFQVFTGDTIAGLDK